MKDYEKHLDNGAVLAKRGYCYFLYESEVALQNDDYEVGRNIERINAGVPVFNRCEVGSWFAMSRKMKDIMNCYNECFKRRKTMEMIRIYNRKTGEILEKTFSNSEDADNYEVILDFLMAEYERYHDGERIY